MSQALINFLAGLRNTAKDGLKTTVDNTEANPVPTSIVGSLAKLSTEEFPEGQEGWTLLEYNEVDSTTKAYVYIAGAWRELK